MSKLVICNFEQFGQFSTAITNCEITDDNIRIEICSSGGDIYQSLAYTAKILETTSEVTTVAYGECCSSAVLPFLAGKKRLASELCWFMVHECQLMGDSDDTTVTSAKQDIDQRLREEEQYYKLLARFTKKNAKWWKKKIEGKGDVWFDAFEAKELGMVDELF